MALICFDVQFILLFVDLSMKTQKTQQKRDFLEFVDDWCQYQFNQ